MEKSKNLKQIYLIYFVMLVAFIGLRIVSAYGGFNIFGNLFVRDGVATVLIQFVIMFLIPLGLLMYFKKWKVKQTFSFLGFKKINWKAVLIAFGIGLIVFFLNLFIASFFSFIIKILGYNPEGTSTGITYSTFAQFLYGVVFVGMFPGFFEEIMHRGLVLRGTAKSLGYKRAILISSVLFGLTHLNIEQFFYATILGLIMGFLVVVCDSIFPAMIIHFTNNFVNVYLSYAKTAGLPGGNFTTGLSNALSGGSLMLWFIVCVALISLSLFLLIWLVIRLFRETKIKRLNDTFNRIEKEIKGENTERPFTDLEVLRSFELFVFPNIQDVDAPFNLMMPRSEADAFKPDLKTNLFLYASLFLGILITMFTFFWGMIWLN